MTQRTLLALALPLALAACASAPKVTETNLQHHHWNLVSIDGVAIDTEVKSDLEIGEGFRINGLAGCNRFFGEAKLDGKTLLAPHLATTMMACMDNAQQIETAVLSTLNSAPSIQLNGQELILNGAHQLVYKLADWM